jgi:hypothetical protein
MGRLVEGGPGESARWILDWPHLLGHLEFTPWEIWMYISGVVQGSVRCRIENMGDKWRSRY